MMRASIDGPAAPFSTGCNENKRISRGFNSSKSRNSSRKRNRRKLVVVQDLLSPDYILNKVFRKDGPALAVEFDEPPLCERMAAPRDDGSGIIECRKTLNKRKFGKPGLSEKRTSRRTVTGTKHGRGKGLMTLWQTSNHDTAWASKSHCPKLVGLRKCRAGLQNQQSNKRLSGRKINDNKKLQVKRNKVKRNKNENSADMQGGKCELGAMRTKLERQSDVFSDLIDDEELELRELQAGPSPLKCSAHFSTTELHFCSLCKGFLGKFPPKSVKMINPFSNHPWNLCSQLTKKFFKVLRFLYTHADMINICSFSFDEFIQAFHDKDSLLLGKIHIALLRFLFYITEMELSSQCRPHTSKSFLFLEFAHSVQLQELEIWRRFLNSLTWVEILHQVLLAAGFGSKSVHRRRLKKEMDILVKYGLHPGTLKYVLFSVLSNAGNNGLKISELVHFVQTSGLNLEKETEEVEHLIGSTLASDITLFERISCAAYRLHYKFDSSAVVELESENLSSVIEEASEVMEAHCIYNEFESHSFARHRDVCQHKGDGTVNEHAEIDESNKGEICLLGLGEGEYSDLSIEEKMDVLIALVDLCPADAVSSNAESSLKSSYSGPTTAIKEDMGVSGHPMQCVFLGSDRRYNRYWLFLGVCSITDPGHNRIYFESSEDGQWAVINTAKALYNLMQGLDSRGRREAQLVDSLEKVMVFLCQSMSGKLMTDSGSKQLVLYDRRNTAVTEDNTSPVSVVDNNFFQSTCVNDVVFPCAAVNKDGEIVHNQWVHLQAFDAWLWGDFYSNMNTVKNYKSSSYALFTRCGSCHDLYWKDEKHCMKCHSTFELDFDLEEKYAIHAATCKAAGESCNIPKDKVFSSQLQLLKAAMYAMEIVLVQESLAATWTKSSHNLWIKRLRRSSSMADLIQVIIDLIDAVDGNWLPKKNDHSNTHKLIQELFRLFSTIPQTSSAVSLWLVRLDDLVGPLLPSSKPGKRTAHAA